MNQILSIITIGILISLFSCKEKKHTKPNNQSLSFLEKLEKVSDSTRVGQIVIKNLFKSQILAHKGNDFDSLMIIKMVYKAHQSLWDHCYAMIFGEENATKFNTKSGMVNWNRDLYLRDKEFLHQRAALLINMNLDSLLETNLNKFNKLVPYPVVSTISILYTPITGILFGGCDNEQFCIELNYKEQHIDYTIKKGLPHELNHLAYDPLRENDLKKNTALRQTIDEGFACYFTWIFFDREIPKFEAVENMTEKEWDWYLENEKKIYLKTKQFFDDESGDSPLLRNDKIKLFEKAPKSLNYWLGFRIIEKYVQRNGPDSWRDIYELNVQDVLEKSGYEKYINELK